MHLDARNGTVELGGRPVPFRLERRRGRRKVSILVDLHEGLLLRTPPRFPLRDVGPLRREESDWSLRRLGERDDWHRRHPPRRFESGAVLPLLGESWSLELRRQPGRRRAKVRAGEWRIHAELPRDGDARAALESWYRRLARRIVIERIRYWAPRIGRWPAKVSLRDTRSRWGSCSGEGNLSFNWKILLAPPAILDYLVVHELCHLVHADHGEGFWSLVESHVPDYRRRRDWLKKRGETLYF